MNKLAFKITISFIAIYGIFITFGAISLVSWGHTNLFKEMIVFMLSYPIDWRNLIVNKSVFFLVINIGFWAFIVYLLSLMVIGTIKILKS